MAAHNKGKKNRKIGRNAVKCMRYMIEGRREKNRARKILRHLKSHPNDRAAETSL